jgi:hypothetical protein
MVLPAAKGVSQMLVSSDNSTASDAAAAPATGLQQNGLQDAGGAGIALRTARRPDDGSGARP